jgi:uncharacterized protein YndB with AHSA1/START domain
VTNSAGVIAIDQYLAHPPAQVWRTLTDPRLLARWLMPNDFAPVVGHRFTFHTKPRPDLGFDGTVHCEVLELTPERLLRLAWRGGRLDSTVTWTLRPEGKGTRLFLEHAGFDTDDPAQLHAYTAMGGGWRSIMTHALDRMLLAPSG